MHAIGLYCYAGPKSTTMKKLLLVLGLLITLTTTLSTTTSAQQVARGLTASNGEFVGFWEYTPTDYAANPTMTYPVIIFLHGIGERGNGTTQLGSILGAGPPKLINQGHTMRFFWNGKWETFLVLSPQLSPGYSNWQNFYVEEMVKYAKTTLRGDPNRIFLTGLSLGGGGTWWYSSTSNTNAAQFAAIAPVCGTCSMNNPATLASQNVPVWAFHAANDGVVSVACTNSAINAINMQNPAVKPYVHIYPGGGHGIWDWAYTPDNSIHNINMFEWFLGKDRSLPVNQVPVANAGVDVTISASSGIVNLSAAASTDADGVIRRVIWTKISGPSFGLINTPVSVDGLTSITGLTQPGTYEYEVKVVDNRTDWSTDRIIVTVVAGPLPNLPPISNAGNNQVTVIASVSLNGTASYDPDGAISSYKWRKISGPPAITIDNDASATPVISGLIAGTYQMELETTDNLGARSRDTVEVMETLVVVPVKWIFVKGKHTGNTVQLNWATAAEVNNDRFEIERSDNGRDFSKVGQVNGSSTSTSTKEYSFEDVQPRSGTSYYRIRQVDKNGTSEYSIIVTVNSSISRARLEYFPNPASSFINLMVDDKGTGPVQIRIYNMEGKLVKEQQFIKQDQILTATVQIQQLTSGIYMMEVRMGGEWKEVRKIVKQ